MGLPPGSRFGTYEILSALGAGGMGEVYRARDSRLNRDVAIKILLPAVANDRDRLARFSREAQVLASLNHPNIAAIYGVEGAADATALVLELVDGPTLADLIAKGPIPLDEALPIARQIADALEAAHERDVIHRDLKPANVKVRRDGTVKVLDFGLAKTLDDGATASSSAPQSAPITTPAMTEAGMILGTAAYMSPEQSRGGVVDRRSDVWAFGCVLYEMLTGRRAFEGEDLSDTLVAVRKAEPAWSALPPATPDSIRRLLRRCLAKDRKTRLPDIGSARLDIDEALAAPADDRPAAAASQPRWVRGWVWVPALVALTAVLAGGAMWLAMREPPSGPIRLTIGLPDPTLTGASINNWDMAISPDGQRVVYLAGEGSSLQLYLRPLDQLQAKMLPAGDDVVSPFFSPDGEWIGFVEESAGPMEAVMKRMAITGGTPVTIAPVAGIRGASWSSDGTIVFATLDVKSGLLRVPVAGGTPEPITAPPDVGTDYYYPEVLPGGRAVLYTIVRPRQGGSSSGPFQVAVLDLSTREQKVLIEGGSNARYSTSGHLVYAVEGTLRAVPFDLRTLQVRGDPAPVLDGVVTKPPGVADFAVAQNGTLVYRTGSVFGQGARTLVWVDRQGREEPVPAPPRRYSHLSLSPDGAQVALDVQDQQNDIWIWNFDRQILSRASFDAAPEGSTVWTPDGKRIAYTRVGDNSGLYWQMADGSGSPERLTRSDRPQIPTGFSPDGHSLIFSEPLAAPRDLATVGMTGERATELLLGNTPFDETGGDISPDGRWLAYESNESGKREIFVRPFPNVTAGRWQVSTNGGTRPKWSRTGRELFYWVPTSEATGQLMAAPIETGPTFTSRPPRLAFPRSYLTGETGRAYDVSADGQRFLMIKDAPAARSSPAEFVVVLHWVEELKRLVPTIKR